MAAPIYVQPHIPTNKLYKTTLCTHLTQRQAMYGLLQFESHNPILIQVIRRLQARDHMLQFPFLH